MVAQRSCQYLAGVERRHILTFESRFVLRRQRFPKASRRGGAQYVFQEQDHEEPSMLNIVAGSEG